MALAALVDNMNIYKWHLYREKPIERTVMKLGFLNNTKDSFIETSLNINLATNYCTFNFRVGKTKFVLDFDFNIGKSERVLSRPFLVGLTADELARELQKMTSYIGKHSSDRVYKPEDIRIGSKTIMSYTERAAYLKNSELGKLYGFTQDNKEV